MGFFSLFKKEKARKIIDDLSKEEGKLVQEEKAQLLDAGTFGHLIRGYSEWCADVDEHNHIKRKQCEVKLIENLKRWNIDSLEFPFFEKVLKNGVEKYVGDNLSHGIGKIDNIFAAKNYCNKMFKDFFNPQSMVFHTSVIAKTDDVFRKPIEGIAKSAMARNSEHRYFLEYVFFIFEYSFIVKSLKMIAQNHEKIHEHLIKELKSEHELLENAHHLK